MLFGCLVEDPPAYTKPGQTPPRLNLKQTKPLINQVFVTTVDETIDFEIGVSSEDAGDKVLGYLLVDYPGGKRWPDWGAAEVTPSTLEDNSRKLTFRVVVQDPSFLGNAVGCHRVTLRVSHDANFIDIEVPLAFDEQDVAEAYWWLNVLDPLSGPNGSVPTVCPTATQTDP